MSDEYKDVSLLVGVWNNNDANNYYIHSVNFRGRLLAELVTHYGNTVNIDRRGIDWELYQRRN